MSEQPSNNLGDSIAANSHLSPAEATAKLAEMTAAANPPPPIAPSTAADARRRLDVLVADAVWGKKFTSGDAEARRTFAELTAKAAEADDVAQALDGTAPPQRVLETTVDGALPRHVVAEAVADMRAAGISDAAIAQAVRGDPVSRQEAEAVRHFQRMRHGDPEWCKRLLAGDYAATREHKLMAIVLSAPIKDGAA
jgi:hypothetical protein